MRQPGWGNQRGQIGKWIALVFLAIVAIGIICAYWVSMSPENYREPNPPALSTQSATGQFGDFEEGGFGLRRVVLIVKSISKTPTDLNQLELRMWVDHRRMDENAFGPYKVKNILYPEKTRIEKFDVIEFDINVARPRIPPLSELEFKFVDANYGAYVSDASFRVPETKDKFLTLPH